MMGFDILKEYPTFLHGLATAIVFLGFLKWFFRWISPRKNLPPGPMGLPIVGYFPFLGKEYHKTLWNLRKRYGDVIGLKFGSTYTVVLNKFDVAKEVLSHPAALDRAPHLFDHLPEIGFSVANGAEWKEQRRFVVSSIKELGIGTGKFEKTIFDEVCHFIKCLQDQKGSPFDISDALATSIAASVIALLIGRPLDKEEEGDRIKQSLVYADVAMRYFAPNRAVVLVPGYQRLLKFLKVAAHEKALHVIEDFRLFFRHEIDRHKVSPDYRHAKDFINIYLERLSQLPPSDISNHFFTEKNLAGNLHLYYLGALDSTFGSLVWILRVIAKYQDVQAKILTELTDVFGSSEKSCFNGRHRVPYTFAVMMETQRFSSIVPVSALRRANDDIEVRGYTIPKGADITANLWALHHDPEYWEEPDLFKPERFIDPNGKLILNHPSYAPFSIGKRDCPGRNIAVMEIFFYLAEVVKHFHVSCEEGQGASFEEAGGMVKILKPQKLCFKSRS